MIPHISLSYSIRDFLFSFVPHFAAIAFVATDEYSAFWGKVNNRTFSGAYS